MKTDSKLYVHYKDEAMLPYAFCYLHELYPRWNGWNMNFMRDDQLSLPDFVIERRNGSIISRVIVMVVMQKQITKKNIINMKNYVAVMQHEKYFEIEKLIIVPKGCDVSSVPEDIRIIELKEIHVN